MKKTTLITMSLLGVLSAEAALQHRYIFNESVVDMVGEKDATPSTPGKYTEAPQYGTDVPAGVIEGAPLQSMKVGMQYGVKKSGFSLKKTFDNPGAMSLWIKPDQLAKGRYVFLAVGSGLKIVQNEGALVFGMGTRSNKRSVKVPIATDTWMHLVATWDVSQSEAAFYADGKLVSAVDDLSQDINMVMPECLAKYMFRGTGCINRARPDLWGRPSGNRGRYPEMVIAE